MEEEHDNEKNYVEMVINCVIVGLVGIVCIIGNILVIRALIWSKYPKIPIYIAIGGLAVADLIHIVMQIPYIIFEEVGHKGLVTTPYCKAHFYLTSVCTYVAAAHMVLFSIIRCIMLNDRVHSRSYVKHTIIGCIATWILICFSNILNLKTVAFDESIELCVELNSELGPEDERIMWLRFSFSYLIPLMVVFILYILTKCLSKRFFDESYSSREKRFSRMVTFLVLTFAMFKLPNEIVYFMIFYKTREMMTYPLYDPSPESDMLFEQLNTLFKVQRYIISVALLDLGIRPLIYAKFSYYFGNSFDEVINCNSCREKKQRPRRKKTDSGTSVQTNDSGMSALTRLTEEEINDKDCSIRDDYEYDEAEDDSLEEVSEPSIDETQISKEPIHVSVFINNEKNDYFIGSVCDEKNGMILGVKLESSKIDVND